MNVAAVCRCRAMEWRAQVVQPETRENLPLEVGKIASHVDREDNSASSKQQTALLEQTCIYPAFTRQRSGAVLPRQYLIVALF